MSDSSSIETAQEVVPVTPLEAKDTNDKEQLFQSVSLVIREVENRYREGLLAYMDAIARFEEEIGMLEGKISRLKALSAPDEAKLSLHAEEVRVEERMLERLNAELLQKIATYEAFLNEYADMVDEAATAKVKRTKSREIVMLHDEIEESELKLLQIELERINLIEKLEPIRQEIRHLEGLKSELERKKKHFALTRLQQAHTAPAALTAASSATPLAEESSKEESSAT
jgi:chromosome segregation ATPase